MHFWESFHNSHSEYTINNKIIEQKPFHKDLGITSTNDLNWAKHTSIICAKAYQTLGLLRRTFKTNGVEAKKQLYISLVRFQVLYCSQLWRPQLLKDIQSLEHIQCRATKFILNNYSLPYKLRLEQLHLLPLMYIYELNDLMFFVKFLQSPHPYFDVQKFVQFASNNTRSAAAHKLVQCQSHTSLHRHFYFTRIVRLQNYLPVINVSLPSQIIKNQLVKYLWQIFLAKFNSDFPCTFHLLCPCY